MKRLLKAFSKTALGIASTAVFAGMVALPVQATAVVSFAPPAANFYFGNPTLSLPPSISNIPLVADGGYHSFSDGLGGSTSANLNLLSSPNVDLHVSNTGSGRIKGGAGIQYFYTISGPGTGLVAGTLTTSMSVSGVGVVDVAALLSGTDIPFTFNPAVDPGVCISAFCPGYASSLTNKHLTLNFNRSGEIDLAVVARVTGPGSATAFIDPVIELPTGYKLQLSPGAGNMAAAVPEPETYALMMAGLAVLGFAVRRKVDA